MAGDHGFNEVFFDNVRVPATNLVGEENRGWYVGATLLDFERSSIAGRRRATQAASSTVCWTSPQAAARRHRPLADAVVRLRAGGAGDRGWRSGRMHQPIGSPRCRQRGQVPEPRSVGRPSCFARSVGQRIAITGVRLHGAAEPVQPGTAAGDAGRRPYGLDYLETVPSTIAAGTSEIQRNIIATRGLGLPHA